MTTAEPPQSEHGAGSIAPQLIEGDYRDARPGLTRGVSIHEFLTDGSLAGMCAELSQMVGVGVQLRDEVGRRIIASTSAMPADGETKPWRTLSYAESGTPPEAADRIAIVVDRRAIGEMVLMPGGEPEQRERLLRTLRMLAAAASELCADVLELRHRVQALRALSRLSHQLANQDASVEDALDAALDAALDVFELSAGSIVLFPEDADGPGAEDDEGEMRLLAARNLSTAWLDNPVPLSQNREFDRIVLGGETLAIDDLSRDPRVVEAFRLDEENIRGFLSAAMVFGGKPIGLIRLYSAKPRSFSTGERRLLQSLADQSAAVVQQARLLRVQRRERRMERQLTLAADVQTRMLPESLPEVPGIDIAAKSVPSYELGGDVFDVFQLPHHHESPRIAEPPAHTDPIGLVVGDVVGKGVAAALLMASVRGGLRAVAHRDAPVDSVISRVNAAMCRDTLAHEFATLWYGVLDPTSRVLTYASAGHEPPFVVRRQTGEDGMPRVPTLDDIHPLGIGGLVLGVDPDQSYETFSVDLRPGDVLIAYTDGMQDARNYDDERFGYKRLAESVLEILTQYPDAPAQVVIDHVYWRIRGFTGLRRQADDETMIVLRVQ